MQQFLRQAVGARATEADTACPRPYKQNFGLQTHECLGIPAATHCARVCLVVIGARRSGIPDVIDRSIGFGAR